MSIAGSGATRGNNRLGTQAEQESEAGLLLLDSVNRPVYASPAAIRILLYPREPVKVHSLGSYLAKRMQSVSFESRKPQGISYANELISGKRKYSCRFFVLASGWKNFRAPAAVVLLERACQISSLVSSITKHFQLTRREEETLKLLLGGLTSKEIAQRMQISPNTVKSFLRLVMIKMGVSNRPGIIGKIFEAQAVSATRL
jgi:DNA-binding CsgD family transcriptional regulator